MRSVKEDVKRSPAITSRPEKPQKCHFREVVYYFHSNQEIEFKELYQHQHPLYDLLWFDLWQCCNCCEARDLRRYTIALERCRLHKDLGYFYLQLVSHCFCKVKLKSTAPKGLSAASWCLYEVQKRLQLQTKALPHHPVPFQVCVWPRTKNLPPDLQPLPPHKSLALDRHAWSNPWRQNCQAPRGATGGDWQRHSYLELSRDPVAAFSVDFFYLPIVLFRSLIHIWFTLI